MWQAMDDDSADLVEIKELDEENSSFRQLKEWINLRHERMIGRTNIKPPGKKGKNDMDVDGLAARDGWLVWLSVAPNADLATIIAR